MPSYYNYVLISLVYLVNLSYVLPFLSYVFDKLDFRATRYSECSNSIDRWISSHQECVSITVEPPGIHIATFLKHSNLSVNITIHNFPAKQKNETYACRFMQGSKLINVTTGLQRNMNTMYCEIPKVSVHTEAAIELLLRNNVGNTAVLSSAPFLFFECGYYKRCKECVSTYAANCHWCSKTATCQAMKLCSGDSNVGTYCPELLDARGSYFVPNRITTGLDITIANIAQEPTLIYKCAVPETSFEVQADVIANNTISCPITILKSGDGNKHYKILILYGSQSGLLAEINDVFNNFVTVYSCSELTSDCSHCRALNKTRYSCDWCDHECTYSKSNCMSTCPTPFITKVIPKDGPMQGGTKLTISGTDLGKNVSEVDLVTVAGKQCSLSDNLEDYDVAQSDNFETLVPSRLVCITGESTNETTGTVDVTVNGRTSRSHVTFTYKEVTVTTIYPTFGPQAGGTKITLIGDNLGIGNRKIKVLLGSRLCEQAGIFPNISLERDSNFTVECTTQSSREAHNVSTLALVMEGVLVLHHRQITYSYVTNPVVKMISPQAGFLSGGTTVTVTGMYMNNAHSSFLQTTYEEELQVEICEIKTPEKTFCKVPEAPQRIKEFILERLETCLDCVEVFMLIGFDGARHNFVLTYFPDPLIHRLPGDGNVVTLDSNSHRLTITGDYLNYVATIFDVRVTVGVEPCAIINLTLISIVCIAPVTKPQSGIPGLENPEVNVTIGNIHKTIGYVQYTKEFNTLVIVLSVAGGVAFIALTVLGIVVIYRKYRQMQNKIRYLERTQGENETTAVAMESRHTTTAETGVHGSPTVNDDISDNDIVPNNESSLGNVYEKVDGYLESRPYLRLNKEYATSGVDNLGASGSQKESDQDYIHPMSDTNSE